MRDTIYRDDAIRVASGYCHPPNVAKELAKLPSAQPERKTGRWVANRYCSVCDFDKKEFDYICGWKENFCPNCGAKMEAEHDD